MSDPLGPRRPPVMTTVVVREELARFAEALEAKLRANDHKSHWRDMTLPYLYDRLEEELRELYAATAESDEAVQGECLDVAAFAMFVWDVLAEKAGTVEKGKGRGLSPDGLFTLLRSHVMEQAAIIQSLRQELAATKGDGTWMPK